MITKKEYTYKVFNRDTFVADMPPNLVKSDFQYTQGINEFGAQMTIDLNKTFDNLSPSASADFFIDELNNFLTDENNNNLTTNNLDYTFGELPIYVGYYIEVWRVSPDYPSAAKVFAGTIISWTMNYGANEGISLNVISHGLKLKNYPIRDSGGTSLSPSFSSVDPSSIVRTAIGQYTSYGGTLDVSDLVDENGNSIVDESGNNLVTIASLINYTLSSIPDTETTVSYTFQLNTLMEAIQKALELAPSDWYFYVDPGTGVFTFKSQSQSPDHTFTNKKHLTDVTLTRTIENMANDVYYSGGDDGSGMNVLVEKTNTASITAYDHWLDKESDQRVTLSSTADLLAQGILDRSAWPVFQGSITVDSNKYDIESIMPGQMVAFQGFDDVINNLYMQIIKIDRNPDRVVLTLNSQLPKVSKRVEDIKRNLDVVNSINNPTSAS